MGDYQWVAVRVSADHLRQTLQLAPDEEHRGAVIAEILTKTMRVFLLQLLLLTHPAKDKEQVRAHRKAMHMPAVT